MTQWFENCFRGARVLAAIAVLLPAPARAGGSTDDRTGVEKFGEEPIRSFALKVNRTLDQHRVNVAIVARTGRPRKELPRGIRYTHVAFVVFEPVRGADGAVFHTYTVYNLYQEPPDQDDRAYLRQDFTYNFVAGVAEPEIAVCVPDEALQRRILTVIRSPAYRQLFHPEYNLFANPSADKYDNCVTHTLKVCVAAIYGTDDAARIRDDIREYFTPTRVHLSFVQSLHASFMKSLRSDDQARSGYQTATYESLAAFLSGNHLVREMFTIAMDPPAGSAGGF